MEIGLAQEVTCGDRHCCGLLEESAVQALNQRQEASRGFERCQTGWGLVAEALKIAQACPILVLEIRFGKNVEAVHAGAGPLGFHLCHCPGQRGLLGR